MGWNLFDMFYSIVVIMITAIQNFPFGEWEPLNSAPSVLQMLEVLTLGWSPFVYLILFHFFFIFTDLPYFHFVGAISYSFPRLLLI